MKFRIIRSIIVMIISLMIQSFNVQAQNIIELSLDECITRALEENLQLKAKKQNLLRDDYAIIQEESKFDTKLSSEWLRKEEQASTYFDYYGVSSIVSNSTEFNVSLNKMLPKGTELGIGFYNTFSESNIEAEKNYSSYYGINWKQPILNGFGDKINKTDIFLARIEREISGFDVESRAQELVYEIQKIYWRLVFYNNSLDILEVSLSQADSLHAYTQRGYKLGVFTEPDVLEAKSELLKREQEIIQRKNEITIYENLLLNLLNFHPDSATVPSIITTDSLRVVSIGIDPEADLMEALTLRPEYNIIIQEIDQEKQELALAKNDMLPELNILGRYRFYGSGETFNKHVRDLHLNNEDRGWTVGLQFSYPLQNRFAKAEYQKKMVSLKKSQLILDSLKNQIKTEILNSVHNIRTTNKMIDVTRASVKVNELKLKRELELLYNQRTTSYYVLEFQRDLAEAKNSYNQALLDNLLATIEYQKARGSLLKDMNIAIVSLKN